jgi:hypothetical protein
LWTANNGEEATQVTPDEGKVDPITIEELTEVIKNIKSRKSPGSGGINNELLKYAPKSCLFKLLDFLNICWIYGHIPEEWRIAVVVHIYKKGDKKNCDNYRGISLLNTGYKIYAKIITQRLMTIAEVILLKEQNDFRKYRTCMDCILLSVSQMIEKHREYNIPTYIAFIDLEKVFDTVNRAKIWEILRNKGISRHLIRTVQSMYMNTVIKITKEFKTREDFKQIPQGVRQGCPLSPTVFNLIFDEVVRK